MKYGQRKPTKQEIEKLEEVKKSLTESPLFKSLQEMSKEYYSNLERIQKDFKPVLDQMNNIKEEQAKRSEMFKSMFSAPKSLTYYRPVEYRILDELKELNKKKDTPVKKTNQNELVITYNTQDGSLDRIFGGKIFSYDLTEDGKRKRLIDLLVRDPSFVKTEKLKTYLNCPTTQAVAKIVQTLNDYAINTLRLKNTKLIQGKKGSGYRINPKIIVIIE